MNRQNEALEIESFFSCRRLIAILTWYHAEEHGSRQRTYKCLLMYRFGLSFVGTQCVIYQNFGSLRSRHILKAFRYISSLFGIIIIASCFIPVHVFGYLCCRGSWCWCCSSSFLLLSIRLVVFIVVVVFVSILFLIRSLAVPHRAYHYQFFTRQRRHRRSLCCHCALTVISIHLSILA